MRKKDYYTELAKCVRCGACKAYCPTYLSTRDETKGARGRVAMLGALGERNLEPTKNLSDKIFSCMLCEACKGRCPAGIDIPEAIYTGREQLKDHFTRGRLLKKAMKVSLNRMDRTFSLLRGLQKILYRPLYKTGKIRYFPAITPSPFKSTTRVYKSTKKIGRVSIFAGCSVNYFYPHLGDALLNILRTIGYEVVIIKGEACCGAPARSFGLEQEAVTLAQKNIELFNKMNVEAIVSMCPTCTMTIRKQYPLLVNSTIDRIMDVNEFLVQALPRENLKGFQRVVTYQDPCHLRYGLNIIEEPRKLIRAVQGVKFIEMKNREECCGFGGFFSMNFKELSIDMGKSKIGRIKDTWADSVITSCPGCMMQLEDIRDRTGSPVEIMHIVELIDEAMHDENKLRKS